MKAQTADRIHDAFRAGKVIDSALKRAAASAKKSAGAASKSRTKNTASQTKTTK